MTAQPVKFGDLDEIQRQQAYFVAAVMAYGRCYAQSGSGIPTLDAKAVYKGSTEGMAIHRRLIEIRNTVAAHTSKSDLIRVTLAVKEEEKRFAARHHERGADE